MSGFEIVGVVFAVFPLILSGLEKYGQGFEVVRTVFNRNDAYNDCRRRLKREQRVFNGNIERLLKPIVVDDQQRNELLADLDGSSWTSPHLEQSIRDRLSGNYDVYLETVQGISELLKSLSVSLKIDDQRLQALLAPVKDAEGVVLQTSPKSAYLLPNKWQFMIAPTFRLRLALGKQGRDELFDSLKEQNERLRTFLADSDDLADLSARTIQSKNKAKFPSSPLLQCWRHAQDIHTLLQKVWRCQCRSSHHAELILRHFESSKGLDFRFTFRYTRTLSDLDNAPWDSRGVRIVLGESPALNHPTQGRNSPSDLVKQVATKQVAGVDRGSTYNYGRNILIPGATVLALFPGASENKEPEITDLCRTIADPLYEWQCLGSTGNSQHRYYVHSVENHGAPTNEIEHITLDAILKRTSSVTLNVSQRYAIALAVASSFLQLYSSPWLGHQWGKEDIQFVYHKQKTIFNDEPRILRKFGSNHDPSGTPDNPDVLNLGVILMELCFDINFEDRLARQRLIESGVPSHPAIKSAVESRAAREVYDSLRTEKPPSLSFATAIDWCLRRSDPDRRFDLEQKSWRAKFLAQVVEPLEKCSRKASGLI